MTKGAFEMVESDGVLTQLVTIYGKGSADGLYPTEEQWNRFLQQPDDLALVTIQFARFKSDFLSYETQLAATTYSEVSQRLLKAIGIEVFYEGVFGSTLYGDDRDDWDFVGMLRFAKKKAFLELFLNPEYIAVHGARDLMMERYKMIISYPPFSHPAPWKNAAR